MHMYWEIRALTKLPINNLTYFSLRWPHKQLVWGAEENVDLSNKLQSTKMKSVTKAVKFLLRGINNFISFLQVSKANDQKFFWTNLSISKF